MAKLIVKSGDLNMAQVIELKPGVTRFGRNPRSDFPLSDPSVSDQHCEIFVERDLVLVKDLGSTNGTFINRQPITEATLFAGQTLQIGPLEMTLDAPEVRMAIPELPPLPRPDPVVSDRLKDGYEACLHHPQRHAVWECTHCGRFQCDDCIRKLKRVGGTAVKLCMACSHQCKLSPWSDMMRAKKRSIFVKMVDTVKNGFKMTKKLVRK